MIKLYKLYRFKIIWIELQYKSCNKKSSKKLQISSHLLFVYINNQDRKWRMSVLVFSSALVRLLVVSMHRPHLALYQQVLNYPTRPRGGAVRVQSSAWMVVLDQPLYIHAFWFFHTEYTYFFFLGYSYSVHQWNFCWSFSFHANNDLRNYDNNWLSLYMLIYCQTITWITWVENRFFKLIIFILRKTY